ncbi:hypothetical protein K8R43_05925 [archaeon]|nr:hypothetical protein [archaeon]
MRKKSNYKGHEYLNKHPTYQRLESAGKQKVEKGIKYVLKEWHAGKAVKTSELRKYLNDTAVRYKPPNQEPIQNRKVTSILKEILPYIPIRTGKLFTRQSNGTPPITDSAMHKNLRNGFTGLNSPILIASGQSRNKTIKKLNQEAPSTNQEVIFFPCHSINEVSTQEFLGKLSPFFKERKHEWFLGKKPVEPNHYFYLAKWEKEQLEKMKNPKTKKPHHP